MATRRGLFRILAGAAAAPVAAALPKEEIFRYTFPNRPRYPMVYGNHRYPLPIDRTVRVVGQGFQPGTEISIIKKDVDNWVLDTLKSKEKVMEDSKQDRDAKKSDGWPPQARLEINVRRDALEQHLTNRYRQRVLNRARRCEKDGAEESVIVAAGIARREFSDLDKERRIQRHFLRCEHLARMFIKGKPYSKAEPLTHTRPDWSEVEDLILEHLNSYDPRTVQQKFAAWKADADRYFYPQKGSPRSYYDIKKFGV